MRTRAKKEDKPLHMRATFYDVRLSSIKYIGCVRAIMDVSSLVPSETGSNCIFSSRLVVINDKALKASQPYSV